MNKYFKIFLTFYILCASFCLALEISTEEFAALKIITSEVAKDRDAIVIGIGRSPSAIISIFKKNNPSQAYNLPLSGFRYGIGNTDKLTLEEEKRLFQHFDKFVPSNEITNGKKIILVDYSTRAHSLLSAKYYLSRYFISRKRSEQIELVAICEPNSAKKIKKIANDNNAIIQTIPVLNDALSHKFFAQLFDRYSEFVPFDIKFPKTIVIKNSDHEVLSKAIDAHWDHSTSPSENRVSSIGAKFLSLCTYIFGKLR